MNRRFDLVVLGGGCAGLSLATKLADLEGGGRTVAVLEGRDAYERDRTWCTWSVGEHRFSSCVDHSWKCWQVRQGSASVVHSSADARYEHIAADRFYEEALRTIERSSAVRLRTGVRVLAVDDRGDRVEVETSNGRYVADLVVDTRPSHPRPGAMLQHFGGLHVRTKAAVFDPDVVTLMDFDVRQDLGVHFAYVLPFAPDEALVEATFFGLAPHTEATYESLVRGYLAERFGTAVHRCLWRERGVLPMVAGRPRVGESPRVLRAGGAAATTKPSTGYAFTAIQQQTDRLAAQIVAGVAVDAPARTATSDALDRVFLRYLRRSPKEVPATLLRLFRQVRPEPLTRFLTDRARPADLLEVVAAMPKLPFLRAALAPATWA